MINIKNVKQIGTPREENKIYMENMAYGKIKEESYQEKRVFVLMGHTERMESKYATFIEAAIPVRNMEFSGGMPKWNNSAWSEVFREIKRQYEDMIIVGWALDVRGMSLKLTPELERAHREHFGGVHQLFFLLDTLEQEELFYIYKENKMVSKDGFYIYYKARKTENLRSFPKAAPEIDVAVEIADVEVRRGGKYRQLMQEQPKVEKDNGNIGVAVAVALLVFVMGVSVYENSGFKLGKENSIETNLLQNEADTELDTQTSVDIIEVEVIPGAE